MWFKIFIVCLILAMTLGYCNKVYKTTANKNVEIHS